ncbi:hypothetical protein ACH5RR_041032 [Cinchona calisaya]|uniref:Uncharacterized protein n=1 Tax=Cinchona calisaya TaxID=153742 RepID=A0ABD2XWD9_9GENT
MPRFDRILMEHKIPLVGGYKHYKQPPKQLLDEVAVKVEEEVESLLTADFNELVIYVKWLPNMVQLVKANMYQFLESESASPNREYPMLIVDILIDAWLEASS